VQWTLVVPLKPLARAKSRLSDTAADGLRPGLALAFALDTVAAALGCFVADVPAVLRLVLCLLFFRRTVMPPTTRKATAAATMVKTTNLVQFQGFGGWGAAGPHPGCGG